MLVVPSPFIFIPNLKSICIAKTNKNQDKISVNQIYDMLYMMDRDDILVGLGGEAGSWNTIPYNQILMDIFCGKSVPLFFNEGKGRDGGKWNG
ncbi:hypothetical protein V6Z11_A06G036600 [Gossypium hirsutum]|uniref:Uncharacterized protein isoform X2 n=1 Tax=Gossypium hirsutum TaxID=3635 RepID=A0ABM3BUV2_GOSHI|nr:uncharacterized protein LOC121230319 isoform X2 [Gossypium hirsutum]